MHETQRRLLTGLLVAVVVLGGAAVASRIMSQNGSSATLGGTGKALGARGRVVFRLSEAGGRVDSTSFTAQALGVARLTPAQLAAQLPGWTLASQASGVTFARAKGGFPLYVGLDHGQVAIFFGPPRYGWLDQMTGIAVGGLRPQDAQRIATGVPVANVGAAWQMLEGLVP